MLPPTNFQTKCNRLDQHFIPPDILPPREVFYPVSMPGRINTTNYPPPMYPNEFGYRIPLRTPFPLPTPSNFPRPEPFHNNANSVTPAYFNRNPNQFYCDYYAQNSYSTHNSVPMHFSRGIPQPPSRPSLEKYPSNGLQHYSNSEIPHQKFSRSNTNSNWKMNPMNSRHFRFQKNYSCDSCNRSFENQKYLDIHISEHESCPSPECTFSAHAKIVEFHFVNVHGRGLNIQTNSKSDVELWLRERKRKFPTRDNIKRNQLLQEEKLNRGLLSKSNSENRHMERLNRKDEFGYSNEMSNKQLTRRQKYLAKFKRPGSESMHSIKTEYASSNDECEPDEQPIMREPSTLLSAHVERKEEPHCKDIKPHLKVFQRFQHAKRPTLLEKLLSSDIRHERNCLIQCVKFISDNNFFGLEI